MSRELFDRLEPEIAKAFIAAIEDLKSNAQVAVVQRALEEGRIDDALRALQLGEEFFAPLDDAMRAAYIEGGRDALSGLPALAAPFRALALRYALQSVIQERSSGSESGQEASSVKSLGNNNET